MKSIKFLSVFAVLAIILFVSCSKQVLLEKRLDGKWNIDSLVYDELINGVINPSSKVSYNYAGVVLLERNKKTNTGSFTYTVLGSTGFLTITEWTNTEDKLTIVETDGTYSETKVYDIITNSSNRQVWKTSLTSTTGGVTVVQETTYNLSRRK